MIKHTASVRLPIVATVAGAALVSTAVTAATAQGTPPSVIIFDQPVANQTVEMSYAYLPSSGYAVVYGSGPDGKPVRTAIGTAQLKAGDHRNVKIVLNEQPKSGQRLWLWLSLYGDTDGKAGFDPTGDKAIWPSNLPAENAFVVR